MFISCVSGCNMMEQYTILGRIGEGAHGIVYKAKHVEVSENNSILYHTNKLDATINPNAAGG